MKQARNAGENPALDQYHATFYCRSCTTAQERIAAHRYPRELLYGAGCRRSYNRCRQFFMKGFLVADQGIVVTVLDMFFESDEDNELSDVEKSSHLLQNCRMKILERHTVIERDGSNTLFGPRGADGLSHTVK